MQSKLKEKDELQCTILETKMTEGHGHTIDALLVNGDLREQDRILMMGLEGVIDTKIRSLLTPHPLKELRVKSEYVHHKQLFAAQGCKIAAQNLEFALAGSSLYR